MAPRLSAAALSALRIAARHGPLKVYRHGWDATGLGRGHATGTIEALARRGLLVLSGDRKQRVAIITEAGRTAAAAAELK